VQLLREYAQENGITIGQDFIDVETAARAGRTAFGSMMQFLGKQECNAILVEKTDRRYRNIEDWVLVDELAVDIHFVEGTSRRPAAATFLSAFRGCSWRPTIPRMERNASTRSFVL
jgi:hypothetical protein